MNELLALIVSGAIFLAPANMVIEGSVDLDPHYWLELACQKVVLPPEQELIVIHRGQFKWQDRFKWVDKVYPMFVHLERGTKYTCNTTGFALIRARTLSP